MIIDTHAHVNFNAFKNDADEVIRRSLSNDVWMINIGSQYTTSKRAVDIAERYEEGVYAAIGLHPMHLETGSVKFKDDTDEIEFRTHEESFAYDDYKKLAGSSKVVAVGEIGLDYYYKPKTKTRITQFKEKQKEVLLEQMKLAQELGLPVAYHCRMAHEDLRKIFKEFEGKLEGVIHCFTGNMEDMKQYIDMGLHVGLNGVIFKLDIDDVIKETPLDKILLETDCPYLTPPEAENKRNEPIYVKYVAEKVAQLKGMSLEELSNKTTENAKNLFKI